MMGKDAQEVGRSKVLGPSVLAELTRVGAGHVSSKGPSSILDVSVGVVVSISLAASMVGQGSKVGRDSVPLFSFAQSVVSVNELDDRAGYEDEGVFYQKQKMKIGGAIMLL
ncbi:hypothetical protein LWI29_029590 [Acer saccharum]|uniref:Uncharacterized protein n=1 Tax=Acer saccharum TaxID=4024 RepID=A0AA39RF21_ACESA|nr:hypothetical protein LWI29_029590 [Acer saccharum]